MREEKCPPDQDEKAVNPQLFWEEEKHQKGFTGVPKECSMPWGIVGFQQKSLLLKAK